MEEKQEATAVWAINHLRHVDGNPLWWPAIRCQPEDVPGVVPPPISNRVLVRYTGPATSKEKDFDCYWVVPDEVMDFEEYREQFQGQPSAQHEQDMAVAIQEASDHMQSLTALEAERAGLETDLNYIVDNIPNSNQSGYRVYADERKEALEESGCPVGDPEYLEEALRKEYLALPESERRGHEKRGREEYVVVMQKARNVLAQRGKRYLDLCERLGMAAHPTLVPIIRLLLVPPEEEAPWGKGAQGKQFKGQSFKRERQDSPIRGHNSNSGASSQMHGYQGVDQNGGIARKVQKTMTLGASHSLDDADPNHGPVIELQRPPEDLTVRVMCNGYEGILYPAFSKVIHDDREFTAPQFEQFCGAGSTKKWKISLRVVPGSVPECPIGERPMLVGKWLEKKGYASGNLRTKSGQKFTRPSLGA